MTEVKIESDEDIRIPQRNHGVTLKAVLQTASQDLMESHEFLNASWGRAAYQASLCRRRRSLEIHLLQAVRTCCDNHLCWWDYTLRCGPCLRYVGFIRWNYKNLHVILKSSGHWSGPCKGSLFQSFCSSWLFGFADRMGNSRGKKDRIWWFSADFF
jgi:hypothetical protein